MKRLATETGPTYPPRTMRADTAAAYLDMSRASFLRLVDDGAMPPPTKVRGMALWDRIELDRAFEDLKDGGGEPTTNTVLKRLRELQHERRREGSDKVPVPQN